MAVQDIKLKVAEAIQDDVNKGIVRMDSNFMKEVGVKPGDIVEIEGGRKTVAVVDRAYPGDIGLAIIRMDGIIRRNAKTGIGEQITIRAAKVTEAKSVTVAPARKGIIVRASPHIFKQNLLGRAAVKGDIISLGGTRRRRSTMTGSPFFDDVFSMLDENTMGFGLGDLKFIVVDANPKTAVIITENTEVIFNPEAVEVEEDKILDTTYEDVGGLRDEIKKVREMIELPLKHPEIFEQLGIEPPKGVLLHGPPGTGKTLLAKAVANETNANFIVINGPEIMSKFYGQSEANLRKKFEDAEKNAPSIIFIDEIDAIAGKREESHGEVEKRVVAQLLAIMDGLKSRGKVVVIAATNIPNALDPALRRPGRFDREIEIGVPNKRGRLKILKIHTRNMPIDDTPMSVDHSLSLDITSTHLGKILEQVTAKDLASSLVSVPKESEEFNELVQEQFVGIFSKHLPDVSPRMRDFLHECIKTISIQLSNLTNKEMDAARIETNITEKISTLKNSELELLVRDTVREITLSDLADVTHGFVGADLSALTKEAAMIVLRRILPDLSANEDTIPKEVLDKLRITADDFKEALKSVRPSALREVLIDKPNVKWNHIGGLEHVKQEIKEAVEWPLKFPESFQRLGIRPPRGVLLYGPPGTGKTLLAKAVANEAEANFISVKGPELLVKWVGESEKAIREVFKKARQASPTIIFFDEIDSIAPNRGSSSDGMGGVQDSIVNQLLTEMDGLEEMNDVVVIGATNRPDRIDTALLRPGRFDRIILTPAPDEATRKEIFSVHTQGMPISSVDLSSLAAQTEGYVGADIEAVCREAAILALREEIDANEIKMSHFEKAVKKVRPSVTEDIKKSYEQLKDQFSQATAKQMQEEKPQYFG